jgi:hypothetical protein
MSGGHFNYTNDTLCREIYNWMVSPNYGDRGFNQSKLARQVDPFEDIIISELIFDVFCLMHSYDWYASADTGEETYRKDVQKFKDKWLKQMPEERIKEIIEDELNLARERLYNAFSKN